MSDSPISSIPPKASIGASFVIGASRPLNEDEKRIYEWLRKHYPRICEHYRAAKHLVEAHSINSSFFLDTVLECTVAHIGRELVKYILDKMGEGTDAEKLSRLLQLTYGDGGQQGVDVKVIYEPILAHKLSKYAHLNDIEGNISFVVDRFLEIENFIRELTRPNYERIEELDDVLQEANS